MDKVDLKRAIQECMRDYMMDCPPENVPATAASGGTSYNFYGTINVNILGDELTGVTAFRTLIKAQEKPQESKEGTQKYPVAVPGSKTG